MECLISYMNVWSKKMDLGNEGGIDRWMEILGIIHIKLPKKNQME